MDSARVALPLFQTGNGGSTPTSTLQLRFYPCHRDFAARLNMVWHSRLPNFSNECVCTFAFNAEYQDVTYAVALWSRPVARLLPQTWYELRRFAISPDAPRNTASRFLGWMARYIHKADPSCPMLVSYSDTQVHTGTIYKACGWTNVGKTHGGGACGWSNRVRFRSEINGKEVLHSIKHRWQKPLA